MIMRYWMDAREFRQFAPAVNSTCIFRIKDVKAWMQPANYKNKACKARRMNATVRRDLRSQQ
jgi:hypothetical protein